MFMRVKVNEWANSGSREKKKGRNREYIFIGSR
jgi:hypothetical protein